MGWLRMENPNINGLFGYLHFRRSPCVMSNLRNVDIFTPDGMRHNRSAVGPDSRRKNRKDMTVHHCFLPLPWDFWARPACPKKSSASDDLVTLLASFKYDLWVEGIGIGLLDAGSCQVAAEECQSTTGSWGVSSPKNPWGLVAIPWEVSEAEGCPGMPLMDPFVVISPRKNFTETSFVNLGLTSYRFFWKQTLEQRSIM